MSALIPVTSGIYKITCTVTGKFYIGSAINLRRRRYHHFTEMQCNKHKNPKMQNAWNKYGAESFTFEVLELVLIPEMLTAREQHWIDTLHPFFNIAPIAGSHLGMKRPLETGKRISDAKKGKPSTRIGWKPTPEQVERARLSRIGYKQTEEHKHNAAQTRVGKKRSPQTREKIRQSALGHAPTNAKTYIVTSPDGTEYLVHGLKQFCREHHLNASCLTGIARGERKQHKGWKARYVA